MLKRDFQLITTYDYICICLSVCQFVYIYMYICICIYVYMCVRACECVRALFRRLSLMHVTSISISTLITAMQNADHTASGGFDRSSSFFSRRKRINTFLSHVPRIYAMLEDIWVYPLRGTHIK